VPPSFSAAPPSHAPSSDERLLIFISRSAPSASPGAVLHHRGRCVMLQLHLSEEPRLVTLPPASAQRRHLRTTPPPSLASLLRLSMTPATVSASRRCRRTSSCLHHATCHSDEAQEGRVPEREYIYLHATYGGDVHFALQDTRSVGGHFTLQDTSSVGGVKMCLLCAKYTRC
jgi:hypothetical protein